MNKFALCKKTGRLPTGKATLDQPTRTIRAGPVRDQNVIECVSE
ncbi:MAG: hypothetical protein ABIQ36_08980 [Rhodanobacter sp.]